MQFSDRFVRTVIVSDSPDFIRAAYEWIESEPGLVLVATAESGFAAIVTVNVLRPDLVLVDVTMSAMDGVEMTRRLRAGSEAPAVVLITPQDPSVIASAAADAGADAVISRRELAESTESIMRTVVARVRRGFAR